MECNKVGMVSAWGISLWLVTLLFGAPIQAASDNAPQERDPQERERAVGGVLVPEQIPVQVDLRFAGDLPEVGGRAEGEPPAPPESVEAILRARPVASPVAAAEAVEPVLTTVKVPGTVRLELTGGSTWQLEVEAEGWWAPLAWIVPRPPSREGEKRSDVAVHLRPTAPLGGLLVPPAGDALPEVVSVRFEAADRAERQSLPRTTVECPLDALNRFRCELPVGRLDLSVRAEGFVPHYFWDRRPGDSKLTWLGALRLVRGASLVGWVVDEAGEPLPPEAGLGVTPVPSGTAALARRDEEGGEGRETALERVQPNPEGFFQLTGLLPGAYVLRLEAEGFAPTDSPVVGIVGEREAELLAPLVIRRPLDLVVQVDPPADEEGEPWGLMVLAPRRNAPVAAGEVDPSGRWRAPDVSAGTYTILLRDSRKRRVLKERVQLDAESGVVSLTVERVEVEGEVRLGDEPLAAAQVAFGGRNGLVSIRMKADDEGRFSGWLPRAGTWRVDVGSRQPRVNRNLEGIEVDEGEDGSPARVLLELPDTLLEGQVVDAEGRPVVKAVVLVTRVPAAEMPASDPVDGDGRFRMRGLELGTYRLQPVGVSPEGGQVHGAPVDVQLDEAVPYAEARLVLAPPVVLSGRVLSPWGGVPGAKVMAVPKDLSGSLLNPTLTRPDGSFRLTLPPGTQQVDLTVLAPGYVLVLQEGVRVREGEPLVVRVEQGHGGTLRLLGLGPRRPVLEDATVGVLYEGRQIWDATLREWAALHRLSLDGTDLTVPLLPPGLWSVCPPGGSEDRCESVFLGPGSVIELGLSQ